jgi:hypothetical protein
MEASDSSPSLQGRIKHSSSVVEARCACFLKGAAAALIALTRMPRAQASRTLETAASRYGSDVVGDRAQDPPASP